jgi:hypothetical protein
MNVRQPFILFELFLRRLNRLREKSVIHHQTYISPISTADNTLDFRVRQSSNGLCVAELGHF